MIPSKSWFVILSYCQVIFEEQNMEISDEDHQDILRYRMIFHSIREYYGEGYVNRLVMDQKVMEYLSENAAVTA